MGDGAITHGIYTAMPDLARFGISDKQLVELVQAFILATECAPNQLSTLIQNNLYVGYDTNNGRNYVKVEHGWLVHMMLYKYYKAKASYSKIHSPYTSNTFFVENELSHILQVLASKQVIDRYTGIDARYFTINQSDSFLNQDIIRGYQSFIIKEWSYKETIQLMFYYYNNRKKKNGKL